MPSESDSPIERQLRDYAEQRRNAAPEDQFKIHPVTRNSLKVEIVKQYGRRLPGQQEEPSRWSLFWPKLAFAGTGLAILVVALVVFQPASVTEPESEIAMNERPVVDEVLDLPEPQSNDEGFIPVDAMPPRPAERRDAESVHEFRRIAPKVAPAAGPRPETAETSFPTTSPALTVDTSRQQASRSVASVATDVQVSSVADRGNTVVLQTFRFIMNGDQVTVVDEDNSRYQGSIKPLNPDVIASGGAWGPPSLGEATDPDFPRKYRLYSESGGRSGRMTAGQFTVRGLNQTLGKEIQFSGRMLTWTQAEPATSASPTSGASAILQIQGTATWDDEVPVQVNATTSAE